MKRLQLHPAVPRFKEKAVRLQLSTNSKGIPRASQGLSVTILNLRDWKCQLGSRGFPVPVKSSTPAKWNRKSKLAIITKSASMNEAERTPNLKTRALVRQKSTHLLALSKHARRFVRL